MHSTRKLLSLAGTVSDEGFVSLASLQNLSFPEIRNKFSDVLSYSQAKHLFHEAREQWKKNKTLESSIFTRANPQLPQAIRIGLQPSVASRSYDSMFGSRSSTFVKSGSVASMFSPAGYLTELYRESRDLHPDISAYNLDVRRPDLAELTLSQENMDDEISTLSLSNEIMMSHAEKQNSKSGDKLLQYFATHRQSGNTPYHQPYETLRQSILILDPMLQALSFSPDVMAKADPVSLISIISNVSPELFDILIEPLNEKDAEDLFNKNFPETYSSKESLTAASLANYYGIDESKIFEHIKALQIDNSVSLKNNQNEPSYNNGKVSFLKTDIYGNISKATISTSELISTTKNCNYWELINIKGYQYCIRTSFSDNGGVISVHKETGYTGHIKGSNANTNYYSYPFNLPELDTSGTILLKAYRYSVDGNNPSYQAEATFTLSTEPDALSYLKLNKSIRLCKATGISAIELDNIVRNDNDSGTINESVLSKVFTTIYLRDIYKCSMADAMVLSGMTISQFSAESEISQFDLLFNTPSLSGEWFSADNSKINLSPDATDDSFSRDCLLRGLSLTRGELFQLGLMSGLITTTNTTFTLNLVNISILYRLSLVASLNNLTVYELHLLFSVISVDIANSTGLVKYIYQLSHWMEEAGISASEVWILTSDDHPEALTPEMLTLRSTITAAVSAQDVSAAADDTARRRLVAPYIAGTLGLSSPDLAAALVSWCETAGHFTLTELLELLLQDILDTDDEGILSGYLHVLAQYSLTVQALSLSEAEVNVFAGFPGARQLLPYAAQSNGLARLMSLHYFHQWLNTLGLESSAVLAALNEGKLTTALVASAMGQDEVVLNQALRCVDEASSNKTELQDWQTIYQILQWVNVASALNTMPKVVKQLVDIRLSGTKEKQPSWEEWKNLSRSLEIALTERQHTMLSNYTAERLSEVLCNWFLANGEIADTGMKSRDDLYSYFLIDNQVSAEVKTTRLAEAISSIQLYINRTLNRIEPDAQLTIISRQFFSDWEINCRYSTWGGTSRLVYYPENYVDPLQRIGQTRMMDELLQYINQSQLSEDTVEDAFKAYLARFETVADLKVISVYHNNVNSDSGKTWFIGRSRESVPQYYWRNTDISYLSRDGKLAANAWSEWVKIDVAINAWKDSVRPIIFRDRLNIVWIEREEVATNGTSTPVISYRFTLKLSFLRHDGNWSSPWIFDITTSVNGLKLSANELPGFTISEHDSEGFLIAAVYKMSHSYTTSINAQRIHIHSDGTYLTYSGLGAFSSMETFFSRFKSENDNTIIYRASYRLTEASLSAGTGGFSKTNFGKIYLSTLTASAKNTAVDIVSSEPILILKNVKVDVEFTTAGPYGIRPQQLKLLGGSGKVGDIFVIASSVPMSNLWTSEIYSTYNKSNGVIGYIRATGALGDYKDNRSFFALSNTNSSLVTDNELSYKISDGNKDEAYYSAGTGKESDFKSKKYTVSGYKDKTSGNLYLGFSQSVVSYLDFNSAVTPENVVISVLTGNKTQLYSAKEYASETSITTDFLTPKNFYFDELIINISDVTFINNSAAVDLTFSAGSNGELGSVTQVITIYKSNYEVESILTMYETDTGVQYLQTGAHRIRLNTLLAPQLVSRANTGINSILSMDTQLLPEPKLGEGAFATLELATYTSSYHGSNRNYDVYVTYSGKDYLVFSGTLNEDTPTVVTIFFPCPAGSTKISYTVQFQKKKTSSVVFSRPNASTPDGWVLETNPEDREYLNSVSGLQQSTTPLDFNSSSAIYYWELFYYVPMMCFRRLLQERKFEEARIWINYVWNPNGYIVNGEISPWTWNCRPLEETTSWNANPLDTIDPDAVAQHDPTHYKVATFINFIEFLIARGDDKFRLLERDAFAEAKMWYVYALSLMGNEPSDYGTANWDIPTLSSAASTTTRTTYQEMLAEIEPIIFPLANEEHDDDSNGAKVVEVDTDSSVPDMSKSQPRTANSLTGLFLPEYNPALTQMWATLRLRLYNLRNNLSIDGQPLSLSIYAEPSDPATMLSSMVQASQGGAVLPAGTLSLYRFPVMLERARNMVGQLTQFGGSLMSMAEHDDADEFSTLLMQQGMELMAQSVRLQERTVAETEADITTLKITLNGAQTRFDKYTILYDEDVSTGERQAMELADSASSLTLAGQAISLVGGAADLVPNTFGLACGGSRWGALSHAMSNGMSLQAASKQVSADKVSRSEMYRRRREEWEIQRINAQSEVDQIEAQLAGLTIRLEAAQLQMDYLETQQGQTLAQLEFMQRKFTNQALYSWMRGKLSAIYYQFFDIAQSCCLITQEALRRELNDNSLTFIRGSAWNGATAGFMAGETLLLNLAEMDKAWMERDERALEVTRTVSLAQVYAGLPEDDAFTFKDEVAALLGNTSNRDKGNEGNNLKVTTDNELTASVKLSGLSIKDDYKSSLGSTRCLKQVSVTLPALIGPYEDVRAVLNYGGSVVMPRGCNAIAVSHGMNDSGQFQLDFNDARYLPFEGIPVDDTGSLTLSFPDATGRQKALLESLNDIILHIRYTIQS